MGMFMKSDQACGVCLSAALVLGLMAPFSPAAATQLRANYTAYYLRLPVGTGVLTIDIEEDRYEARLSGEVSGAASLASGFSFEMQSRGKYQNGQLAPEKYIYTSRAAKDVRNLQMSFKSSSVTDVTMEPPLPDLGRRVPISTEHRQNVVDPLSALVAAMTSTHPKPVTAGGEALRIHGGNIRADVSTSFLQMQATQTAAYRGPASLCSVRYNPVAGHIADASYVKFMRDNQQIRVSSVPTRGPFEVLVHASVPLQMGTVRIELTEARIDGVVVDLKR